MGLNLKNYKYGSFELEQSELNNKGSFIKGKIEWRQYTDVYSPVNTTYVELKFYVKKGNSTTTLTDPTTGTWKHVATFNDYSSVPQSPSASHKSVLLDWVHIGTYTRSIKHAADGTASPRVGGYIIGPEDTSIDGLITEGYKTIELEPIPYPTTIDSLSCVDDEDRTTKYLDGTIKATYTPQYSGFYNRRTVYLNVDGKLTEIRYLNLGRKDAIQQTNNIDLTDKELSDIYDMLPTSTTAKIRVTFRTYRTYADGEYSDQVGTNQSLEIDLTLPESVAPTAELSITPVNTNSFLKDKDIYVSGLSGATATLTDTDPEGGEVTSRSITYNDSTYNAATLDVTTIKGTGNIKFTAKATDSRGRFAKAEESIDVLPYSAPVVTSMIAERGTYNGRWTSDDDGPDVRLIFKTTVGLKDQGNVYNAVFKLDGSAKSPDYGVTGNLISGASNTVYFQGVNKEVSHTLTLTVTDSVGKTGSAIITVPTTDITIEFRKNGKGIAFGKTSEKDAFECAFDADFSGKVEFTCTAAMKEAIRESLGIRKEIWSGTCNAGETIAVNELQNYMMYRVAMKDLSVPIAVHRSGSYLTGIGGAVSNTGEHKTYIFTARIVNANGEYSETGTYVQLTKLSALQHTASGSHGTLDNRTLVRIIGLL